MNEREKLKAENERLDNSLAQSLSTLQIAQVSFCNELDRLKAENESLKRLCGQMVRTFSRLGWGGRMARIDCRDWHRHYARKLARVGK